MWLLLYNMTKFAEETTIKFPSGNIFDNLQVIITMQPVTIPQDNNHTKDLTAGRDKLNFLFFFLPKTAL